MFYLPSLVPCWLLRFDYIYIYIAFKKSHIKNIFFLLQLVPCAVLAVLIHPSTSHNILNRISWAFCVYLEAVSVLPQLRVMQNTKVCQFL